MDVNEVLQLKQRSLPQFSESLPDHISHLSRAATQHDQKTTLQRFSKPPNGSSDCPTHTLIHSGIVLLGASLGEGAMEWGSEQ